MSVINERMRFETFDDFYLRRNIIKNLFDKCDNDRKEIYKYYLYSSSILSDKKKNCIWNFLVEPRDEFYRTGDHNLRRCYKESDECEYRRRNTEED